MRFVHFLYRDYSTQSFARGADGVFRLPTDWHRYQGQRRYVLSFSERPRWRCLTYTVRAQDGSVLARLTAAKVLTWHLRALQRAGETLIFRPRTGVRPSRLERRRWLQRVIWEALPLDEHAAREMVAAVTPHARVQGRLDRRFTRRRRAVAVYCHVVPLAQHARDAHVRVAASTTHRAHIEAVSSNSVAKPALSRDSVVRARRAGSFVTVPPSTPNVTGRGIHGYAD